MKKRLTFSIPGFVLLVLISSVGGRYIADELPHPTPISATIHVVEVGDIGNGVPSAGEIAACQTINGGEMIYSPQFNGWRCE